MGSLLQDIRYALRLLRKSRGFTATAVLTLALAIGANSAIFSAVDTVLLRPLPFPHPEELMRLFDRQPGYEHASVSYLDFLEWKKALKSFSGLAAVDNRDVNLVGFGAPEVMRTGRATEDLFSVLGVRMLAGRAFNAAEEVVGGPRVVVVSETVAREKLGGVAASIGKILRLDGEGRMVVGVFPKSFRLNGRQLWVPLALDAAEKEPGRHFLQIYGRLAGGTSRAQARAEGEKLVQNLAVALPEQHKGHGMLMIPLHEDLVGKNREMLWLLFGAVGFVLLIACANVANLLLARAAGRAREVSIRAALGASRGRLIRQFLIESVVLSLLGGALGLLVAMWGTALLQNMIPRSISEESLSPDVRVMAFTLGLSVLVGLVFGLVPALQTSRTDLTASIKGSHGAAGAAVGRHPLRSALVVAQIALALIPLTSAGLMLRSLTALQNADHGFDGSQTIVGRLTLPGQSYPGDVPRAAFIENVLGKIRALPQVESAGVVDGLPLGGSQTSSSFEVEGAPPAPPGTENDAGVFAVSPGYFEATRMRLKRGRRFTESDRLGSPAVMIINETLAKRFLGGDGIGRRVTWHDKPAEVVGVVADVRAESLEEGAEPQLYVPYAQAPAAFLWIAVRTRAPVGSMLGELRSAVLQVDADQPLDDVQSFDTVVEGALARRRTTVRLLAAFAALALVLAAVGVYGVMAYTVSQRTRELGVRMALGAQARDVLRLVLGQGVRLSVLGVAVGAVGALMSGQILRSFLYGVEARDPLTFGVVAGGLLLVALLACYLPARRATRVDPAISLRSE